MRRRPCLLASILERVNQPFQRYVLHLKRVDLPNLLASTTLFNDWVLSQSFFVYFEWASSVETSLYVRRSLPRMGESSLVPLWAFLKASLFFQAVK